MGVRARLRAVCVVANPRNNQAIAVVCASQPIPNRIPHTFIRDHEHVLSQAVPWRVSQRVIYCSPLRRASSANRPLWSSWSKPCSTALV